MTMALAPIHPNSEDTKGKKFKLPNFKQLIMSIHNEKMKKQLEMINTSFEDWRGDQEQVDDICVIGIRIWNQNRTNLPYFSN